MSDKKRRDITLGEMQDECRKHEHGGCLNCTKCNPVIKKICDELNVDGFNLIDLANPMRFNEAQMAFWRGWYAMGAKFVRRWKVGHITFLNEYGDTIGTIERHLDLADVLEVDETLDLAELLGKDAT